MTAPTPRVPITVLRETARLRVQAGSLRRTAREIGLSPTGLQGFLDGSEPYAPTMQKLLEWYVQEETRRAIQLSPESADAALALLVRHIPEPRRARAVRHLLRTLASEGGPAPEWLTNLLHAPEEEDPAEGDDEPGTE